MNCNLKARIRYRSPQSSETLRFIEAFPTASGKVQKFVLRDQLRKDMGLENVAGMKTA